MDIISINKAIKDFYRTKYNVEYNKEITLTTEVEGEYTTFLCKMPFNQPDRPLNIMGQFKTIEEFLQYLLKELATNRYPSDVRYFKLIQTDGIEKLGPPTYMAPLKIVVPPEIIVPIKPIGYGALYNKYVLMDERNISSNNDWTVLTTEEWFQFLDRIDSKSPPYYLQYDNVGGYLKEVGETHWLDNIGALNSYGFNAVGSGYRRFDEDSPEIGFSGLKEFCFLNSAYDSVLNISTMFIIYSFSSFLQWGPEDNYVGASIRLCKKSTDLDNGGIGIYIGNDGKKYPTICIEGYEWISCNLNETKYRNGEWIHGFNEGVYTPILNTDWSGLTKGGMCYYNDIIDTGGNPI